MNADQQRAALQAIEVKQGELARQLVQPQKQERPAR
jgi:hypothetical protein